MDAGGLGEVGKDESGCFLFAVFQTKAMKDVLLTFPECLIMDCTFKVPCFFGKGRPAHHGKVPLHLCSAI